MKNIKTANLNQMVKVKLSDFGVKVLEKQHNDLNAWIKADQPPGAKGIGEFELRLDEDGYYHTQLWSLMKKFGQYTQPGFESPFETIEIVLYEH